MMISIHLKIWKQLITKQLPPSSIFLLSPSPFYAKPHLKFPNLCTQIAAPSTTLDKSVIVEFLINKCGLTDEDITKAFKRYNKLLDTKSSQKLEEALQMLNGCGLTAPAQIRRVVLYNPRFLFRSSKMTIHSKLTLLRTFMKEENISKLVCTAPKILDYTEGRIKSGISLLQRLGVEGEALSQLLMYQPRLLMVSDEKVMESFKAAEDLGLSRGSKMFAYVLRNILGVAKETLERRSQCLSNLGIQIPELLRRWPQILGYSEEKVKLQVDFLVKAVGIPLHDLVKYPNLFGYSLEKRIIPRFRLMEALKSMQGLKTEMISPNIFILTEKRFLDKYVNENVNSSILRDIYNHGKVEKLIINKETLSECVSVNKIPTVC